LTELTQSLASAPTETKAPERRAKTNPHAVPTFSELIYAHYAWYQELRGDGVTEETQEHYDQLRSAFQRRHGQIVRSYWCSQVESAVVLTERADRLKGPRCGFHRETHWATRDQPDIANEMYRCDELAVRATTVLTGVRQKICMNLIMASAEHLLSLVDRRAANADPKATARMLEHERKAIKSTEDYYQDAANGQAQMIYFAGMASVVVVLALVATVWLSITWATPVAALIAGAIGAVVSVVQRINSGKFELDVDVGRPYALFLGGLRPLIGGAFAMIISFAFNGGLLNLPVAESGDPKPDKHLALLVISFLAGFSERWAQDTLVAAVPGMGKKEEDAPAPEPTATPAPEQAHGEATPEAGVGE
jgi:hypothetical protein